MRPRGRSGWRCGGDGGFTIVELLVATLLAGVIGGALVGLVLPARRVFEAQPETSDMHQRLRVAVDAVTAELRMAGAGLASDRSPAVMPYRVGRTASDPHAGVFFRPGVVSVAYIASSDGEAITRSYYLRIDRASGAPQLMRYDGLDTDLPVVDRVAAFDLTYFAADEVPLDPAVLQDGPWLASDPDVGLFDADLLRIRRVRVRLRLDATRDLPDHELLFDVALRNTAAAE